jgi:hypothetical protein
MIENRTAMRILHNNNFGNIAKCTCCNDLQLTLGNVLISFTEEEYLDFDLFFDEVRIDFKNEIEKGDYNKDYVIRTNKDNLTLLFSYQELKDTIELLNFSTLMLVVNKLTIV